VRRSVPSSVANSSISAPEGERRATRGTQALLAKASGAGLAAVAVGLGLVDELRVFRYPVIVGGGTPFLPPVTEDVALDLIETRTFGSRVIYERYGRARDESD
jgi:riboflavin biosynthesis pyrimidine reductase